MKNPENENIKTQDQAAGPDDPDVVENIEFCINELCEKYINNLDDPEKIYEKNGLFVDMLKYIYKYYISGLLNNNKGVNNRYDYKLLDHLFNIYTSLVYKYKKNSLPNIIEFTLFTNVSRETLYNIRYGLMRKASPEDLQNVKKWFNECENSLLNNESVASIFKLKAMYGYNDNLAPVPIELQNPVLSVDKLPDLSGINTPKMIENKDHKKGKK